MILADVAPVVQNAAETVQALHGNMTVGLAALGGAIGVGLGAAKTAEAVGRNPGAFGKILIAGLLGMALAEGIAIIAFFGFAGK